jgi:hypothetical protein
MIQCLDTPWGQSVVLVTTDRHERLVQPFHQSSETGDIDLSAGARSNLLPLQCAADLMTQAQQPLSNDKKVNSAIENPTNFFTAASLNNRAGDLVSQLDSIGEILAAGPRSPAVFL